MKQTMQVKIQDIKRLLLGQQVFDSLSAVLVIYQIKDLPVECQSPPFLMIMKKLKDKKDKNGHQKYLSLAI